MEREEVVLGAEMGLGVGGWEGGGNARQCSVVNWASVLECAGCAGIKTHEQKEKEEEEEEEGEGSGAAG